MKIRRKNLQARNNPPFLLVVTIHDVLSLHFILFEANTNTGNNTGKYQKQSPKKPFRLENAPPALFLVPIHDLLSLHFSCSSKSKYWKIPENTGNILENIPETKSVQARNHPPRHNKGVRVASSRKRFSTYFFKYLFRCFDVFVHVFFQTKKACLFIYDQCTLLHQNLKTSGSRAVSSLQVFVSGHLFLMCFRFVSGIFQNLFLPEQE